MAIVREILEAAYGNNNDNTLMVYSHVFFFPILLATCLVAAAAAGNPFKNLSSIHHETLLVVLRIYVYVSVSDSSLYISLGLLQTRRLSLRIL